MVANKRRSRPTISLTLKERTLTMLQHYADKRHGNRSQAVDDITSRYTSLVQSADLSNIEQSTFQTLCLLADGVIPTSTAAPRQALLGCIYQKLGDQDGFRRTLESRPIGFFRDDSHESRETFIKELDAEREHLNAIVSVLETLDPTQSMALLENIEEVLIENTSSTMADRCSFVYERMRAQLRSH